MLLRPPGVYHSAKIRNFKQITTDLVLQNQEKEVFITLQRYEILSKSQRTGIPVFLPQWCLSLCKDTKF